MLFYSHGPLSSFNLWAGAPVVTNPDHDNPAAAADPDQVNNFDYSTDPAQVACPFAAHLRKMNPRAGFPGSAAVRTRRIMRQGIPYGPEVTYDEEAGGKTKLDRGLLFVSVFGRYGFFERL